jgi:hypothetical protein
VSPLIWNVQSRQSTETKSGFWCSGDKGRREGGMTYKNLGFPLGVIKMSGIKG